MKSLLPVLSRGLLLPLMSLGLVSGLSSVASASTYISPTKATRLTLYELPGSPPYQRAGKPTGEYSTRIQGKTWHGAIAITNHKSDQAGHKYYTGTFKDSSYVSGQELTCQGTISIFRTRVSRTEPIGMTATWNVTSGKGCPSIGTVYKVTLREDLPQPDRNGNFTDTNSQGAESSPSQGSTWEKWRVVSADGALNCRQAPNGAIKKVYKSGTTLAAQTERDGTAFFNRADLKTPWLRTSDRCFVRANTQYIQPVSLPF